MLFDTDARDSVASHRRRESDAMIEVPAELVANRVRQHGDEGRRWTESLPDLVEKLCDLWAIDVEPHHEIAHGANAMVVVVRRGLERLVLKVTWHDDTLADEAAALKAWNGHGAVQLVAESLDHGALLLERLDATRTLRDLDVFTAADHAGELIRDLMIPAPDGLPRVAQYGAETARILDLRQRAIGNPIPAAWVDAATTLGLQLAADAGDHLVHAYLHYGNILAGHRAPWLAIDPHAVVGDPELSVPELMWTRIDELSDGQITTLLARIVDAARLDLEKATAWTIVRAVDYWLWGLELGLTIDPARCQRLLTVLT